MAPPVSDEKCLFVTKNDHFLKLCHEYQLEPLLVTKNVIFVKNRGVIISLSICFKNFLTTNGVFDVKQISNYSGMKSAKHERNPHISSGEIISESKHLKGSVEAPFL